MLCFVWMRVQILVAFLLLLPLSLQAEQVTITADRWVSPRSGETVARWQELQQLLTAFDRKPEAQIVIRHAPGENGSLWAEELRSWLVSLGVPSRRIVLKASIKRSDVLIVETTS
ncbi:MAG: hypothetical protein ACE5LB_00160 [Acidiferrobacterales bacterium]